MEGGKRVRVLTVKYTAEIGYHEITLFRGAVNAAMGGEADLLFHNHIDDEKLRYAYPLIQYKRIGGKAAIVYINEACDVLKEHLTLGDVEMKLGNRNIVTRMENVSADEIDMNVQDTYTKYKITSWIPFNTENYHAYQQLDGLIEKVEFMQNILRGNILSMAKGLDIIFDGQINVVILNISTPKTVGMKGTEMLAFDVEFKANVCLPENVGLGKAVSKGHGTIKLI